MSDNPEALLRRAFSLGQTYFQQADSESYAQNRRSEETRQKFEALVVEACAALAQQAATPPAGVRERSPWEALFWTVAKELNCLPSSFVDANDHVIRKAREYAAAAARQAATPAPAEPVATLFRHALVWGQTYGGPALTDGALDAMAAKFAEQVATPPATPAAPQEEA